MGIMSKDQKKSQRVSETGHFVTPEQLCIGLYVHLELGWMQHPFAFSNFKIKDDEQIGKIRALNLKKIRFDPKRSDAVPAFPKTIQANWVQTAPVPEPVVVRDPVQRQARLKQLNDAIIESEQAFSKSATRVREVVRNLEHHPVHCREEAAELVNDWVNSVITEGDVVLHVISSSKAHDNFVHPLNVTVLALMLAKSLDMHEDEAAMLGMAAMFHDVGKEATPSNKSFINLHCELGASIAERSGLSERVSRIILQHHELMDGSGFPSRLKGEEIDPLARLLALVNHFDNLCNPAKAAESMTPYEALSIMYATMQQKFDSTMLRVLVKSLGVYPPGSLVELSNGNYAIAVTTNPDQPMLPVVMLYLPKVARETPVILDLAEDKTLTIKRCLRPEQLPKEVLDYLGTRKRVSYYFLKKQEVDALPMGSGAEVDEQLETAGAGEVSKRRSG
jgi:putative nucleotidyltransferase with HDIG domain